MTNYKLQITNDKLQIRIKPITSKNLPPCGQHLHTAPDKSITHRAIMFNSAAALSSFPEKGCRIGNALLGEDCLNTVECMRALGAEIEVEGDTVIIRKPISLDAVRGKSFKLYAGNSGTTARLLCGLLSGLGIYAELTGDASLSKRPMERVAAPLRLLGADIKTTDGRMPVYISPSVLRGGQVNIETPSAQVKSAVILAALNARGTTAIKESAVTRDHTELMLKSMGADLSTSHTPPVPVIIIRPSVINGTDIEVGGDISSAAYWLVLGAIIPGAKITLKKVNVNPTRTGILTILKQAGCNVGVTDIISAGGEPTADITVEYAPGLKPFEISGGIVPLLIDEIPILAVLACFINGKSVIKNAAELKVKESDRIEAMASGLRTMGADIAAEADGMVINGAGGLIGTDGVIKAYGDHRIAMSMAIAALASARGAEIDDLECCAVSFPQFINELTSMTATCHRDTVPDPACRETCPHDPMCPLDTPHYCLIGQNIGYSASQKIHAAIFENMNIRAGYEIIDAGEGFIKNLRENMRGYAGFNVTKPYKTAVIPHLDALDKSAKVCGAVNTVVCKDGKMKGFNTDGAGFIDSLKYHKVKLNDKRILVLGAGGAARAVVAALINSRYKFKSIAIWNRTPEKAFLLTEQMKCQMCHGDMFHDTQGREPCPRDTQRVIEVLQDLSADYQTDIVINCTTAGQHGAACPLPDGFDYARLSCCIDLIYEPKQTPLLRNAAAAGVKTVNGAAMLVFQAVRAQNLWNGKLSLTKSFIRDIISRLYHEQSHEQKI